MKKMNLHAKQLLLFFALLTASLITQASSHREAPMMFSYDPLADNTDVYAFPSPDDPNTIIIIANYIPFELPEGGPNYYTFGTNIRYEIHIKNKTTTTTDDILYGSALENISRLSLLFDRNK